MKPTVYIETTIPSYLAAAPSRDLVCAETDAIHIAVATVSGIHFLLTWNCTHIANAPLTDRLRTLCLASGYALPVICTPEELMEL